MQHRRLRVGELRNAFVTAIALLSLATSASALVIGDFEAGSLDGWSTSGNVASRGTVIGIAPTLSLGQLVLQTSGGTSDDNGSLDAFFGFAAGTIDGLSPSGNNVTIGSGATLLLLNVQAGDQLTFDFNFVTSEGLGTAATYRDFGFTTIRSGEEGEVVRDDVLVMQRLATTNAAYSQSGWQSISYDFTTGGNITIGFGVTNVQDATVNSAMFIDNIQWLSAPEPGTGLMVSLGLLGLSLRRRRELAAGSLR